MLDNPDAAYAKLREMGKGLFGPDGGGLGNILGSLGSLGGNQAARCRRQVARRTGAGNLLGGRARGRTTRSATSSADGHRRQHR